MPIDVAVVVAKFASFPRAVANSFNVSNVAGAELTRLVIAVETSVVRANVPLAFGRVKKNKGGLIRGIPKIAMKGY